MANRSFDELISPMELTETDPMEEDITGASPEIGEPQHEFENVPLQIPHILDDLLEILTAKIGGSSAEQTLVDEWNECTCASDYLTQLVQIIPLVVQQHAEKKQLALQARGELEMARIQIRRHQTFLRTHENSLSKESVDHYRNLQQRYEHKARKIELFGPHSDKVAKYEHRILLYLRLLRGSVRDALKLEDMLLRGIEIEEQPELKLTESADLDLTDTDASSDEDPDDFDFGKKHVTGPVNTPLAISIMEDIRVGAQTRGRLIAELLQSQEAQERRIDIELEGWTEAGALPNEAFIMPSSVPSTAFLR